MNAAALLWLGSPAVKSNNHCHRGIPPEVLNDSPFLKAIPNTPPPDGSLFWELWESCDSCKSCKLHTGTLSPDEYEAFGISDISYCFPGATSYELVGKCTDNPQLKIFLAKKA